MYLRLSDTLFSIHQSLPSAYDMIVCFLAPTEDLYELLCHRKKERKRGKRERTPQNECFWNNSDPVHLIWTKFGMDILRDDLQLSIFSKRRTTFFSPLTHPPTEKKNKKY